MTDHAASLKAADGVEILTLADNYVDLLLKSEGRVTRPPRAASGVIPSDTLLAEHGLSLLISVAKDSQKHTILLDAGYSPLTVAHNLRQLGVVLDDLETIVLSHGHVDHFGGLKSVLKLLNRPVEVVAHPVALTHQRYFKLPDGGALAYPQPPGREDLERLGARLIENTGPHLLAGGLILVSGEVARRTSFEKGLPTALIKYDGRLEPDPILDDQALILNLADAGLVVVSGCAHSGIVNTVRHAQDLTGVAEVFAVLGGFHLSGPHFEPIIEETIVELKKFDLALVAPMHCTGRKAINRFTEMFGEAFVLNSVGTSLSLP